MKLLILPVFADIFFKVEKPDFCSKIGVWANIGLFLTLYPIARSVLNFFQDLIKNTILRVLRLVCSEFDILSGVEYRVENLRCQHWNLYYSLRS